MLCNKYSGISESCIVIKYFFQNCDHLTILNGKNENIGIFKNYTMSSTMQTRFDLLNI